MESHSEESAGNSLAVRQSEGDIRDTEHRMQPQFRFNAVEGVESFHNAVLFS